MYPKQFLSLLHDETMLQRTLKRLDRLDHAAPTVVCNNEHRFIVAEQARQIGVEDLSIILEPFGRNTAPAIAVAAVHATQQAGDPVLLVLTADHEIPDQQAFTDVVRQALPLAEAGKLVTFGIVPTYAATGYGYIRRGESEGNGYIVDEFVEKPDQSSASAYLASDEYYWNSGMFMFRAQAYLDELQKFKPDMVTRCRQAAANMSEDIGFLRLDAEAFGDCEADSIDYAVMEKTELACVVPMDAGWSDIGSWSSVWEQDEKDEHGNATRGDVITNDTENSIVHAESRLVATVGVSDLVIVETQDAVLVADKQKAQQVKQIVEKLALDSREEENFHRIVGRRGRGIQGQAYQRQTRRAAIEANASSSRRALGRGKRHRARVSRRRDFRPARKRVGLHPAGHHALPRKSR
jgi:mannose-1-phosphate guanylyltransferase